MSLSLAATASLVARLRASSAATGVGGGLCSISARFFGKRKDFGYEKGHDLKNEVRKDKFWRKRNPPRKPWADHKQNLNLHPQVLSWGPVSQTPDWSFESGDPGILNEKQARLRAENVRLAKEVHQAAMLVLKAREFEEHK